MAAACPSCRCPMDPSPGPVPGLTSWRCPACGGGAVRPMQPSDFPSRDYAQTSRSKPFLWRSAVFYFFIGIFGTLVLLAIIAHTCARYGSPAQLNPDSSPNGSNMAVLTYTYGIAFQGSLLVLCFGKWMVLQPIIRSIIRNDNFFAGNNTMLITEFVYKVCVQISVVLAVVAVFLRFGQAPTVSILPFLAIAPIFGNSIAYLKNVRQRSPRPAVYLASGLTADGLGLLCGYLMFVVLLCGYVRA